MKHWLHKLWAPLLFVSYVVLGIAIHGDYGVSWDESISRQNGLVNLRHVNQRFFPPVTRPVLTQVPDLDDWPDRDYGVAFELPVEALDQWMGNDVDQSFRLRHLATFLVFAAGVAALYRAAVSIRGSQLMGLAAALMMVLSPRMFAESFYNSKDVVFMAACAMAIATMSQLLRRRTLPLALLHGFVCALAIDIRVMGIVLPAVTLVAWMVMVLQGNERWPRALALAGTYLLALMAFVYAMFPFLWPHPLENFAAVFGNMSRFRWDGEVLFKGRYVLAEQLPWTYIPVWIGVTTPLPVLGLFVAGTAMTLAALWHRRWRLWCGHAEMMDLVCLALLVGPIAAVVALHSVLYDGWRQLYFVYPALVLLAVRGLDGVLKALGGRVLLRRLALAGLAAAAFWQAQWMVQAHPLQNVFFNGFVHGPWKDRFDLDYWGLGNREALEAILARDPSPFITVGPGSRTELAESLPLVDKKHKDRLIVVGPEITPKYVVTNYRLVRDRSDSQWLKDHDLFWQKKIGDQVILSVFRLRDLSRATPVSRSSRPYTPEELLQLKMELNGRRVVQGSSLVDVTLVNDSDIRFSALSATGNQLALTWRFLDAQGNPVTPWDGRMDLPVDVPPRSRLPLTIAFDPGVYLEGRPLQVDLFQTGRFWAHEAGAPLAILPPDRKTVVP
ncbi:hypothetical protein [Hydrogenophaga sp. RWCD_12]|uniref:hypothetical protein n=1 Tax=Hydrogenophaga sp. RWCD_12 TaxID=3391190 RepID=UPI0039855700